MVSEREIREQIITQLTNVYSSTPDLLEGGKPEEPWVDPDLPTWTPAEIETAYAQVMSMFLYYAKEVESKYGPGFLEHLQRQALADDDDDDSSAPS